MQRRLERSTTNRVWTGVCGGLADYLAIDATLVRVFFVIASVFTGFLFVLVYIALMIIMPLPGHRAPIDDMWPGMRSDSASYPPSPPDAGSTEPGATPPPMPRPHDPAAEERRNNALGFVLIALGLIFLLSNLGAFRFLSWSVTWPVVLIGIGLVFLLQRGRP